MELPFALRKRIIAFLTSAANIADSSGQQALIYRAGLDELKDQIVFGGSAEQFFQLLVPKLGNYGTLKDGRNALAEMLTAVKDSVGLEGQTECVELLQEIDKLPQTPKHRGSFIIEDVFIGRDIIIEKLLMSHRDFFIFGARRIGKTALLRYVEKQFEAQQTLAFCFSIQGDKAADRIKRRIRNGFKRKKIHIDPAIFQENSLFETLEELDASLEEPLVLLIDEAEQIALIEQAEPGFVDRLRNVVESSEHLRFLLTASPHFKKVVAKSQCSAFLSAFEIDFLSVFSEPEACMLIRQLAPDINETEMAQILGFTYYQPYLVRIFIGKLCQNGVLRPITREFALDTYIANALDGIFPNYFDGLHEDEQEIIRRIHQRRFDFGRPYETKLRELTQYGYLNYEEGEYKISNWFFQHWLDSESG